jgi:hypothetical protein
MTYVAIGALVALIICGAALIEAMQLIRELMKESNDREESVRTQLLSVLGKTETVALTFTDKRSANGVRYVDDEEAIAAEKVTMHDEA